MSKRIEILEKIKEFFLPKFNSQRYSIRKYLLNTHRKNELREIRERYEGFGESRSFRL